MGALGAAVRQGWHFATTTSWKQFSAPLVWARSSFYVLSGYFEHSKFSLLVVFRFATIRQMWALRPTEVVALRINELFVPWLGRVGQDCLARWAVSLCTLPRIQALGINFQCNTKLPTRYVLVMI